MDIENLMIDIMDLADDKFKTKNIVGDPIEIGTHCGRIGERDSVWTVWLQRGTPKTIKKQNDVPISDGDTFEAETWFVDDADTLSEALEALLKELQNAEMKRGKNNRMVPVN